MLMKTKKKIVQKLKNLKKRKRWSGDMVDRELPTKFRLDPCNGCREPLVYRRADTCATTVTLLTRSSRAKKEFVIEDACQKGIVVVVGHSAHVPSDDGLIFGIAAAIL